MPYAELTGPNSLINWISLKTTREKLAHISVFSCFVCAFPLFVALKVLNLQMTDGAQGEGHADDTKLHGKPDKTLRFSLCSDNLEGISEGQCAAHKAKTE